MDLSNGVVRIVVIVAVVALMSVLSRYVRHRSRVEKTTVPGQPVLTEDGVTLGPGQQVEEQRAGRFSTAMAWFLIVLGALGFLLGLLLLLGGSETLGAGIILALIFGGLGVLGIWVLRTYRSMRVIDAPDRLVFTDGQGRTSTILHRDITGVSNGYNELVVMAPGLPKGRVKIPYQVFRVPNLCAALIARVRRGDFGANPAAAEALVRQLEAIGNRRGSRQPQS